MRQIWVEGTLEDNYFSVTYDKLTNIISIKDVDHFSDFCGTDLWEIAYFSSN